MRVLFIGDVFGKPGRQLVARHLPAIRKAFDFVIANGENAAGGFGINRESFELLVQAGVDVITLGNHTWDNREVFSLLQDPRLLRPLNYPIGAPGRGWATFKVRTKQGTEPITIVNLMGRLFMTALENPFTALEELLATEQLPGPIIVDFHAEATSEKACFAWHFDGRVAAVLGTHTHVATADTRVLHQGTAFQTDVGMTGPRDSSIGMSIEGAIERFRTGLPQKIAVSEGLSELNAVALEIEGNRSKRVARYRYLEGEASGKYSSETDSFFN